VITFLIIILETPLKGMQAILENSELYIYGDVYYITNYFCKTVLE